MAFGAIHRSVRTKQWEAVLVILHLLRGDIPALNRMALCAVRSKLATMNVGVAIRTILAHVGENWLDVAEGAGHLFVHAAEGIFRFVVIEFRNGADGPPTRSSVTVFAGNAERAMRVARSLILASRLILASGGCTSTGGSSGCGHASEGGKRQKCPESELEQSRREQLPTLRGAGIRRGTVENLRTVSWNSPAQDSCAEVHI